MEDLGEETGLVCVICREGYKFQPSKVLGVYTFTKRCNVEEFEAKPRKTVGYSTVTHFNVVHVDCHMAAVSFVMVFRRACHRKYLILSKHNSTCSVCYLTCEKLLQNCECILPHSRKSSMPCPFYLKTGSE